MQSPWALRSFRLNFETIEQTSDNTLPDENESMSISNEIFSDKIFRIFH